LGEGIERDRATEGVVQKAPRWTPGVEKVASGEQMQRSACAASWQPAAVATP